MRVTLLQAVQKFSWWPTNEDRNKHFKIINPTGGRNLTGQRQTS